MENIRGKLKERRKLLIVATGAIAVVIFIIVAFATQLFGVLKKEAADPENTPSFTVVLPGNKSITSLGGWKRVSPPGSAPAFAFTDKIGDVSISVSEQELPADFTTNTAQRVAELAKSYNASHKIDVDGIEVHIGASVKGPQSIIFSKKNLLVLIKTQQKVEEKDLSAYIKLLN